MPHTLFIADLHLCEEEPAITAGFVAFLRRDARQAEALYILGDLFEAWIGDDDTVSLHAEIAAELRALTRFIPCYFIHGNRDFLVGKRFAAACGMTLLPEEHVLELYGKRILILHGDTLCIDDKGYQHFRRKVHQPWLQALFLILPLFIRQRIATKMRAGSKRANSSKDIAIMDVNAKAVHQAMSHHHVRCLIHGHTHRPAIHQLTVDGNSAERLVLGAWHTQGSMIRVTPAGAELIAFPW